MDFKEKEQKAAKDKNIFKEDGKRYVRRIKKCICMKKQSDTFTLECRIMEHGLRNYFYKAGDLFFGEGSIGEKKLWLCDEALETVTEAVAAFEEIVDKAKGSYRKVYIGKYRFYVYYERIEKERYDFIIEFEGENRIKGHDVFVLQDKTVADLLEEIQFGIMWDYLDTGAWTKEPGSCEEDYFYMAVAGKDEILERLVRLYYREESPEDYRFLSANVFEADMLPYLPEEFDRKYYVTKDSGPDYELLERSGYRFSHRPPFAMQGNTYDAMTLNPHRRTGVDAAPKDGEKITFEEYLKLFGRKRV